MFLGKRRRRMYQAGGAMPPGMEQQMQAAPQEQQAPQQGQAPAPEQGQMEQVAQQVAEMLQQGMPPEEIMKNLVQMGFTQEQAQQLIQQIMQQVQGGQEAQMAPAQ